MENYWIDSKHTQTVMHGHLWIYDFKLNKNIWAKYAFYLPNMGATRGNESTVKYAPH